MQVYAQNQELRVQLKESKQSENLLQEQVKRRDQRLSDLQENYDKLKLHSSSEEIETQLSVMQRKMHDIKGEFSSIDVIKMHLTEVVMITNIYPCMYVCNHYLYSFRYILKQVHNCNCNHSHFNKTLL